MKVIHSPVAQMSNQGGSLFHSVVRKDQAPKIQYTVTKFEPVSMYTVHLQRLTTSSISGALFQTII